MIKLLLKKIIPEIIIKKILFFLMKIKSFKTRKIFKKAVKNNIYLKEEDLSILQTKYDYPPKYGYSKEDLLLRGKERAAELLKIIKNKQVINFLELGCFDGMVSYSLKNKDNNTFAIDLTAEGFDQRAIDKGVIFREMDAIDLDFEDNKFDFIFSYDAFEHFFDPEKVLKEMIRVVKKDGFIYLFFAPLYFSAMGLHAYRSITVPYCQFLFSKRTLSDFTIKNNLELIDFDKVNGWLLEDFKKLFKKYSKQLSIINYREIYDYRYLDLISKYPEYFKNKTNNFDDLIISGIRIIFKRK